MKCSVFFIALCCYKSFGSFAIDCCPCSSCSPNIDVEAGNDVSVDISFNGHSDKYIREENKNGDLIVHTFKVRSDDHVLSKVNDDTHTICYGIYKTVEYIDDDYVLLKVDKKKRCVSLCSSSLYYQKVDLQWSAIKRREYNKLLNEIKTKRKISIDIRSVQEEDYAVEESVDEEKDISYSEYTPKRGTIVASISDGMDVICNLDPNNKRCKKITLVRNNKTGVTYLNVSIPGRFNDLFFTKVKSWEPCTDDDYYNGIGYYREGSSFNIANKNDGLFDIKPFASYVTKRLQFEPKPDTMVNKVHHDNKVLWRKLSDDDELIVACVVYQKNSNNPLMIELVVREAYGFKSSYFSKGSDGWIEIDKCTFGFLWYATEMSNKINPKILLLPEIDPNKKYRTTIIPSKPADRTPTDQDTLDRKPAGDGTARVVVVEGEQAKLKGRNATGEFVDVPSDEFPVPYPQPSYEPKAELEMIDPDGDYPEKG